MTIGLATALLALTLTASPLSGEAPAASTGGGRTFYLSPSGDDRNPGTSPARAWKTLKRASRARYGPGDRLLLQAGARFPGAIALSPTTASGTARSPVTISSYGKGRATIAGTFLAQNVAGIRLTKLRFKGGNPANKGSGIVFMNTGKKTLSGVFVSDVEVSGYTNPIYVLALELPAGYRGIRIERASVHDNAQGPVLFGHLLYPSTLHGERFGLQDVVIRRLHSFRNTGAGLKGGHGAGLVLLNADRVLIERSRIHDNGGDNPEKTPNGPSGITFYDGRNVVIQNNEVFHQRYDRRNQTDNGGIDFWGRRALIQYNYVHDNEGWGFVFGSSDPAVTGAGASWLTSDVTVRYNVAENNGRALRKTESTVPHLGATMLMFGQIERFQVYNNTFFRAGKTPRTHPDLIQGLIYIVDVPGVGKPWSRVYFRNNAFVTQGNSTAVEVPRPTAGSDLRFEGNAYIGSNGRARVKWAYQSYDLSAWRAETGQETVGGRAVGAVGGRSVFCSAGKGAPLRAYRLRAGSPLIDKGLDLRATAGLNVGRRDFFGTRIPAGRAFDVGAHEYRPGRGCAR